MDTRKCTQAVSLSTQIAVTPKLLRERLRAMGGHLCVIQSSSAQPGATPCRATSTQQQSEEKTQGTPVLTEKGSS